MDKTISFVMPCYNDGKTIEKAVDSIRDQDLKGIEIIVVNDGSTDDSKKIIDGLKSEGVIDKVIHFEKNQGACVARNEGTKIAEGKYLSFLPADAILYPGMARIWYETLEDNPDYDFLYGGYRFVDDEGDPIPNMDLLFQTFDPYLLEVTNYIDGSFPIKRESFWKYAKIMNQPDGLWDKNIKSLQDWDFWLSVVKNGGKGIYVQDIFFGTTMPHEGGLSFDSSKNWVERTNAIKDKHNIPHRKLCVASLGASWHAKRIAHLLNADFKEIPSSKPHEYDSLYVIGFYPEFATQQDAMFLNDYYHQENGRTSAKKIIHFVGSDIWQLYHIPLIHLRTVWQPYFKNNIDKILCEAEFTKNELKDLGIEAEVVPIPPAKLYEVRPLPKEFTVACYMPAVNRELYRPNEMIEIAKRMPDVKFKFFGNPVQKGTDPALPKNIEYMGYITDMDSFISECSAIMRFPVHDGLPISVLEFLLAGRYSVQSVPIKHSVFLQNFNVDAAVQGLNEIRKMSANGVNQSGSDYWRQELNHDKFKKRILDIANYDPKTYWEGRAEDWVKQASFTYLPNPEHNDRFRKSFENQVEQIKPILKKYVADTVIDVGCGDGRFYPILTEAGFREYRGFDISDNLVRAAKMRFPHADFASYSLEDSKDSGFDVAFAHTCFEHIKEEDMPKAAKAFKRMGKIGIIIEPTNFQSRNYCISHDYKKYFDVIEELELKPMEGIYENSKMLYVVKGDA